LPQEQNSTFNISEEKLALVDSKLSVAPNGDVFVNQEVRKMLNAEELKSIQEHIKNYNQMPESFKDCRSQAGSVMTQLSETIQTKQISFNEITVSAGCGYRVHIWGVKNQYLILVLKFGSTTV
jgi:hypothetical protein